MNKLPWLILALVSIVASSCGGGYGGPAASNGLNGKYVFTLAAIQGQSNITLNVDLEGIPPTPWPPGTTEKINVSGTAYGLCSASIPGPLSTDWILTQVAATATQPSGISAHMVLWDNFGNGVLDMESNDFVTLSGTWFPLTDVDACTGVQPEAQSTWTGVKQ